MASEMPSDDEIKETEKLFKNWILSDKPEKLNLLISGKTGVGKSRLVNALLGTKVAKEGKTKDPCTSRVESYEKTINNVDVTVWDSPGLQDGTTNEARYIQEMKDNIKDISLMIYCVRMDEARFYDADKKAIQTLTNEFGKEVWNHAVVALTFANKVEDPDEKDELVYFQSQHEEWKKQLNKYFASIGIKPEVCIPVIPVGNWTKKRLPDRENWLSDLWIECYHVMKSSARRGMYRINKERLKIGGSTVTAEKRGDDDFSSSIPLNDQQQQSFFSSTWEAFMPVMEVLAVTAGVVIREIVLKELSSFLKELVNSKMNL